MFKNMVCGIYEQPYISEFDWFDLIWFVVFNATFSNISTILWQPGLVVEEVGVPGENQQPWTSTCSTSSRATAGRVHLFCNLQSRARTHAELVIGLYELLGNITT